VVGDISLKIKPFAVAIILAVACAGIVNGQRRTGRAPKPQPSAAPSPTPAAASLSIEAGLIYNSGDTKPVARTQFFLLDEDLRAILKPFGETPGTLGSKMDFLYAFSDSTKSKAEYDRIKAAVESHVIATATTDFNGKAKLTDLVPGTRFVYGEFHVGSNRVAWNLKVELKAGAETSIILDNSNRSP
jgi:hypothetical protein